MSIELFVLLAIVLLVIVLISFAYEDTRPFASSFETNTVEYEAPADRLLYEAQQRKEAQLADAMKYMGYERKELDLQHVEIKQTAKSLEIDQRERGLDLGRKELDLKSLVQDIRDEKFAVEAQRKQNQLDRYANDLNAEKDQLKLKHGRIDLSLDRLRQLAVDNQQKDTARQLQLRDYESGLKAKENQLKLDAKKQALTNYEIGLGLNALKQQAKENVLSAKAIQIQQEYRENTLRLQQQFLNLESEKLNLHEQQVAFRLDMKYQKDELSIRRFKLDLLETSVNEDYRIKSAWLKIEAGENANEYRRQQQKLDRTKQEIDNGLKSLRLSAWANRVQLKEEDIRRQRFLLGQLRRTWLR